MKGFLTSDQKKELLRELKIESKARYSDRIKVILLLDQGKTYKSIAEYLFLDEGTIANYRKRYVEGGIEGLIMDQYWGKRSFLNLDQEKILVTHLQSKICLSSNEVIHFIRVTFKVKYSISGVTDLLHRLGFTYKKPKGVPGKAILERQLEFVILHDQIKTQGKVFFADSVHPQHNPVLSYGWIEKGKEKEVLTNSGRAHLNIIGALCIETRETIMRSSDTINADAICDLIKALRKAHNIEEKIFLVLDNAPYNRSWKVHLRAEMEGIELIYLPPYSPNLNPIERFWKFFKKKVLYNQYYEKFGDFETACKKFMKGARKYRGELSTLLTDNFRIVGA
jgi:transposase